MYKSKIALFNSLFKLMRPLVKLLLRFGVSHSELTELTKRAYVAVAESEKEFRLDERKQSASRISVLTGLNRKEVAKVHALLENDQLEITSHNRAAQVVNAWLMDDDYQDQAGEPLELSLSEGDANFTTLVKKYSGDMPVRAVLDELLRVGAVKKAQGDLLKLCSKAYIPQTSDDEKLLMFGTSVTDLLNTLEHNIPCSLEDSRLQLTLAYDNLPEEA